MGNNRGWRACVRAATCTCSHSLIPNTQTRTERHFVVSAHAHILTTLSQSDINGVTRMHWMPTPYVASFRNSATITTNNLLSGTGAMTITDTIARCNTQTSCFIYNPILYRQESPVHDLLLHSLGIIKQMFIVATPNTQAAFEFVFLLLLLLSGENESSYSCQVFRETIPGSNSHSFRPLCSTFINTVSSICAHLNSGGAG